MFQRFLSELKQWLQHKIQNFKFGFKSTKLHECAKITLKSKVLKTVKVLTFGFLGEPSIILLTKGIVINIDHDKGEFIYSIFLRSTADGTNRVFLNLKNFSQTLEYNHFKMKVIHSVARIM